MCQLCCNKRNWCNFDLRNRNFLAENPKMYVNIPMRCCHGTTVHHGWHWQRIRCAMSCDCTHVDWGKEPKIYTLKNQVVNVWNALILLGSEKALSNWTLQHKFFIVCYDKVVTIYIYFTIERQSHLWAEKCTINVTTGRSLLVLY